MSIVYLTKQIVVDGRSGRELNIIAFHAGDALNTFVWEGVANYTAKENEDSPDEMGKIFWRIVQMVLMFKKFAQVETKELPAGQRLKDIDCKYTNDTNSNVTYLTSAWFTNLVKSDAFKVRGHFRLQPKKNDKGEWTKELIWINEFQKEGYTAPARKLSEA